MTDLKAGALLLAVAKLHRAIVQLCGAEAVERLKGLMVQQRVPQERVEQCMQALCSPMAVAGYRNTMRMAVEDVHNLLADQM